MPDYSAIIISTLWLAGIPVVIALVNWVKRIKDVGRFNGLIAIGFGIAINLIGIYAFNLFDKISIIGAIVAGVIVGLAASGVYDIKNN